MKASTLGQEKVAVKRVVVKQFEGKSQAYECATVAEACHQMSTLCLLGDHYKGGYTIEWEDGGTYTGKALFFNESKDTNPMRLAKAFLQESVKEDSFYASIGADKEAQAMLDRYF